MKLNVTTNRVTSIQNKAGNVMSVFKKALKDIDKIQTEINIARAKRMETIAKKQSEIADLEVVEAQNAKFAQKLEDFLK